MSQPAARLRSAFWVALFGLILFSSFQIGHSVTTGRVPQYGAPAELYSTQTQDDLKLTLSQAINEAKKSVLLMIYSLKDSGIIKALKEKSEEGIPVRVICDANASSGVARKLGRRVDTTLRRGKGLMHQKILVVDEKKVWLGSANMTTASLKWHSNLVTGFQSASFAANIAKKAQTMADEGVVHPVPAKAFTIGGQKVEMWFLPDNPNGAPKVIQLIRSAQKTLRVAMFTWTRLDFADEIIQAHKRGLDVQVAIDAQSGRGVSAAVVRRLAEGGVPVRLSRGEPLLHYKFMVIDDQVLVNGSANWTKAAFTRNDDCFLVMHRLTATQRRFLQSLWRVIIDESAPYTAK